MAWMCRCHCFGRAAKTSQSPPVFSGARPSCGSYSSRSCGRCVAPIRLAGKRPRARASDRACRGARWSDRLELDHLPPALLGGTPMCPRPRRLRANRCARGRAVTPGSLRTLGNNKRQHVASSSAGNRRPSRRTDPVLTCCHDATACPTYRVGRPILREHLALSQPSRPCAGQGQRLSRASTFFSRLTRSRSMPSLDRVLR